MARHLFRFETLTAMGLAAIVFSTEAVGQTGPADPFGDVVAAERDFAFAAAHASIQEAFLMFLDDEAVLFRPGPMNGPAAVRADSSAAGTLEWEPALVGVSSAGDMAVTTGPYVYRGSGGGPAHYGHFLTVWRRREGGRWRVVLDHGFGYGEPYPQERLGAIEALARVEFRPASSVDASVTLLARDSGTLTVTEQSPEYMVQLDPQARVYRSGRHPVAGQSAIADFLLRQGVNVVRSPLAGEVAASGDVGYTYGTYRNVEPGTGGGSYVRIWRRGSDGRWLILIDLATPHATEAN
jgi:ketosteroid isomerase-like protein